MPTIHRSFSRSVVLSAGRVIALVMTTSTAVLAGDREVKCWKASDYDKDGDGYAEYFAHKDDRQTFNTTDSWALTCPAGWVKARGDCDDNNPLVHPRRFEVYGNNVDDNCDGRADEPTFFYAGNGYYTAPTSVDVAMRVHEPDVVQAHQSSQYDVVVKLEYQRLDNTAATMVTGFLPLSQFAVGTSYSYARVTLTGLSPDTPYRVRAQFYRKQKPLVIAPRGLSSAPSTSRSTNVSTTTASAYAAAPAAESTNWYYTPIYSTTTPLGVQSGWYYTASGSYSTLGNARGALVRRALYEAYLSEHGYTGYRGSWKPDGTRYGGDMGEAWCSEFYSYVASFKLDGMGHRSNVSKVKSYFEGEGAWTSVSDPTDYIYAAQMGDYLAMDTSEDGKKNHSAMFLAIDAADGRVWSVDGNISGRSDIGDSYASRRAGNESTTKARNPEVVLGLGHVEYGMLK